MYAGQIVEAGTAEEVLLAPAAPVHPGPADLDPRRPKRGQRSERDQGRGPQPVPDAAGCKFRAALPALPAGPCEDCEPDLVPAGPNRSRPRAGFLHRARGSEPPRSDPRSGAGDRWRGWAADVTDSLQPIAADDLPGLATDDTAGVCWDRRTSSSTSRSWAGCCAARSADVNAVDDVSLRDLQRRDVRPRRRVGLRQDDLRADVSASRRRPVGPSRWTARTSWPCTATSSEEACAAACSSSSRTRTAR